MNNLEKNNQNNGFKIYLKVYSDNADCDIFVLLKTNKYITLTLRLQQRPVNTYAMWLTNMKVMIRLYNVLYKNV